MNLAYSQFVKFSILGYIFSSALGMKVLADGNVAGNTVAPVAISAASIAADGDFLVTVDATESGTDYVAFGSDKLSGNPRSWISEQISSGNGGQLYFKFGLGGCSKFAQVKSLPHLSCLLVESECRYLAESGADYGAEFVKAKVQELGWAKFLATYRNQDNVLVNDNSLIDDLRNVVPNFDGEYSNGVCFKIAKDSVDIRYPLDSYIDVVIYAVSRSESTGIACAVQKTVSLFIDSLSDYFVFYEYDLECWPGENMTLVGKVHSNGNLWIGADKLLKLECNVTAAGNFYAQRKPDSGFGNTAYVTSPGRVQIRRGDDNDYEGTKPAMYADVINTAKNNKRMDYTGIGANNWEGESLAYYGGALKTGLPKVVVPIDAAADPHAIIERSMLPEESGYSADIEAVKFANKACLTIRIDSSGGLHLYDHHHTEIENSESYMQPALSVSKSSTMTGQYNVQRNTYTYVNNDNQVYSEQVPAYQVDNCIYDRREDCVMQPVDIYINEILNNDRLKSFLYPADITEEEPAEPGVLYVTRDMPLGYPFNVETVEIPVFRPVTNIYQKTSYQLEPGWEEYQPSTPEPLYTVKGIITTYYYYYYDPLTRSIVFISTTTNQGTSYTENGITYNLDFSQTTIAPVTIATGKTADEADVIMSGHPDYYLEQESGFRTKYYLRKTEIIHAQYGTETVCKTNYIPTRPCVRIRNASNLSLAGSDTNGRRGLSIATDLPLYVEGCFNTDGTKGMAGDNYSTHPSALVAADAVTVLSSNWNDALRIPNWQQWNPNVGITSVRPNENLDSRVAVETTFNGILMTGIVESGNGCYSGGLMNLLRFHENWRRDGTVPYNFNGSMICMWLSQWANNPIEASYTYQPPSRRWSWAKMNPPGLPKIMKIQQSESTNIGVKDYKNKADSTFFDDIRQ